MKKFIIIIAVIVVVIGIIALVSRKPDEQQQTQAFRTHEVGRGSITVRMEETGEIEPIREVEIKTKISGKVVKLHVDEGDHVNQGDVIAEIEPDYNQAEMITRINNNLQMAEIRLRNARKDYEDKKKLYEDNFISQRELRTYEDNLLEANLNRESALMQYELIQEIEMEGNVSRLISPASGTVIRKAVEEGEMVIASTGSFSEGTIVVRLADLDRMVVRTRINEVDISKVSEDQRVCINVDAYPHQRYNGEIRRISAMAVTHNNVKVFPLEIEITDVDEKLRPGMTANITIIGEEKEDIVVVPIRSIFRDENEQDIVYKVEYDSISAAVPIRTGINDFQNVEVIEGVEEGDIISLTEPVQRPQTMQMQMRIN
jgi:HlyD family secretion protein